MKIRSATADELKLGPHIQLDLENSDGTVDRFRFGIGAMAPATNIWLARGAVGSKEMEWARKALMGLVEAGGGDVRNVRPQKIVVRRWSRRRRWR